MESRVLFLLLIKVLVVMSVTGCARFRGAQDAEPALVEGQAPVIEPELDRREIEIAAIDTEESAVDLHAAMEEIHALAGRERGSDRYASRPLDIDLLLYDDVVLEHTRFRLPRRDVLDYSFVLRPLSELAPELLHPETGRTMAAHWADFDAASHPLRPVELIL